MVGGEIHWSFSDDVSNVRRQEGLIDRCPLSVSDNEIVPFPRMYNLFDSKLILAFRPISVFLEMRKGMCVVIFSICIQVSGPL